MAGCELGPSHLAVPNERGADNSYAPGFVTTRSHQNQREERAGPSERNATGNHNLVG